MTVKPSLQKLEDIASKLRDEIAKEKKEQELLKFDLEEMQNLNKNLSDELDRLYENITYMVEENKKFGKERYV